MPGRDSERRVDLTKRLARKGARKLLAIDGGGIRGVLSLHILGRIEELLIKESKRPDYRLADYFDYVAGTSTGGIIAAGIALGMSVAEILDFYAKNGAAMFDKASIMRRLRYEYNSEPLAKQLKRVFGEDTTLGAKELECLLLLVMRNATTDSPPHGERGRRAPRGPRRSSPDGLRQSWAEQRRAPDSPVPRESSF